MRIAALFFAGIILLAVFSIPAYAEEPCNIYLFHSKTCPHCIKELAFIAQLEDKYPQLNIQKFEVSENNELFRQVSEQYNTIPVGVPRTIVNGTVFIGFTEEEGEKEYIQGYKAYNGYKNQIEKAIVDYLVAEHKINSSVNASCTSEPIKKEESSLVTIPLIILFLYLMFFFLFRKKLDTNYIIGGFFAVIIVILFYLFQHISPTKIISFTKQFTFPVFTFIIAFLDGFNPCAFAVLAILLSLLVYAQSRKKMAVVGTVFILTSSAVYFLFIVVLLTIRAELLGEYKSVIRVVVGLIALAAGIINIKDFFFFKKGISLTIPEEKMGSIVNRMRNIVNEVKEAKTGRAMFLAILGTIVLAALVNLIELGCTLILPIQYIEVLITNFGTQVSFPHYMYIAFYCIVYVVPLFAILGSFLYTFKSERMTESKGKLMKLIGGLVMLGLGIILLIKPELIAFG